MKNKLSWLAGPYVLWMALVVIVPILLVVVYAFTTSGETAADIGGFTLDNFSRMGTYTVILPAPSSWPWWPLWYACSSATPWPM